MIVLRHRDECADEQRLQCAAQLAVAALCAGRGLVAAVEKRRRAARARRRVARQLLSQQLHHLHLRRVMQRLKEHTCGTQVLCMNDERMESSIEGTVYS